MSESPEVEAATYAELAQQTMLLSRFRGYRTEAEKRRDEVVATETENIETESIRISLVEDRIRELVAELGLV